MPPRHGSQPFLALAALAPAGRLAAPGLLEGASALAAEPNAGTVGSFAELLGEPACNIQLSKLAGPANEVALGIDPGSPLRLLAGAKGYDDAYTDCVTVIWYLSEDGGRTWREGSFHPPRALPLPSHGSALAGLDPRSCESDPVPVFDEGNALLTTLSYACDEPPAGIPAYRLAPGSEAWEPVAQAYEGSTDKPWGDVDAATGEVYLNTLDAKEGAQHLQEVVKTSDGGASWQHVAYFDDIFVAPIAVQPQGHVHLAGLRGSRDGGFMGQPEVILCHSPKGGASWLGSTSLATLPLGFSTFLAGGSKLSRTPPLPVIAASDGTPRVAVAHFDEAGNRDWEVFVRVSPDGGAPWREPVRANDDTGGADQWKRAVALSPTRDLHVMWFDARHDPSGEGRLVDVSYAHRRDGRAFDANLGVPEQSFVPYLARHQAQPFLIRNYLGIQASDVEAAMIWPDTRNERSEVFAAIVGRAPVTWPETESLKPRGRHRLGMGSAQGQGGRAASLRGVAHDLRSALAAATAYLDLARERAARGEPVPEDDLAKVERALALAGEALGRLEALGKGARP